MKKLLTLVSMLTLSAFTLVGQTILGGGADIQFSQSEHDFGQVVQHDEATTVFTFTNNGSEPLLLSDVKGSCSCTVPEWPKQPILPGQKGEIKVKYDTKRVGPINKSVTITSNDSDEPTTVLRIKGNVTAKAG